MESWQLGVAEIAAQVRGRQLSPVEAVTALLIRSAALDPQI